MLTEEGNLISAGASIIRAASNGDADGVRASLAEGACVDQRGRGGHTALMVAAIFGHVDITRHLLAAGADVQLQDNLGLTARDWADRRGSWEVAQLLSNAAPANTEPTPPNAPGKPAQLAVEVVRRNPAAEPEITSQPDALTRAEEQTRAIADPQHHQLAEARDASATEPKIEGHSEALRFMKFHKQIMAAQERRKAEQARLEAQHAPSVVDEQETSKTKLERRQKQARPTVPQLARIAATIEQLRTQEESRQPVEDETRATSERETRATAEYEADHNERDITLERFPAEISARPTMLEPKTSEPFNPALIKRCPECNTTYENPLLVYCAYDATKLVSANDSMSSYPVAKDRSRQALWALVAIVTVLGVSLGYLINNYRSRERVPSAPIASTSNAPIATQTVQPEITTDDSPVISGELSGMEVDVPEAEYPEQARAEGVAGAVTVRIEVNQKGRVVLARSSKGDWRLRAAAVKAAQKATFSAEKLAVRGKVASGTITYNFVAQTESPAATGSPSPTQTSSLPASGSSSGTESSAANLGGDRPVVGGPLVGAESKLPQPDYPEQAKSRGVNGTITVVVRVNRAGKVISWRTLEGDSQLRAAALKAAKKATFSPQKLPGEGEVVGTITYNFK